MKVSWQMSERRKSNRRRVLKAAKVAFEGSAVDCVVRDISPTGAGIQIEAPTGVPHEFHLLIASDHSNRACHVI